MFDFFISYGHDEAVAAHRIARTLRELGSSVWIDAPESVSQATQLIGIPAGQNHWDVICNAIADSCTFLVVDGPDWRSSDYCARELVRARLTGTRLAMVTDEPEKWSGEFVVADPTEVDALVSALEPGDAAAAARVRLEAAATSPGSASLVDRLTGRRGLQDDAVALLADSRGLAYPSPPGWLVEYARKVLVDTERRRSRLRRGGVAVASVFALLAGGSLVSWVAATQDRAVAQEASDQARSLDLAGRSLAAGSAVIGRELAQQALAAQETDAARSALAVNDAELRTIRRVFLPPHPYFFDSAFSPEGTRFAVSYPTGLMVASTSGDLVADVELSGIRAFAFIDSDTILLVHRGPSDTRSLVTRVHLVEGGRLTQEDQVDGSLSHLVAGGDGTIWWADATGALGRYDPGSAAWVVEAKLTGTTSQLAVMSDRLVRVRDDQVVESRRLPLAAGAPEWEVSLSELEALAPSPPGPDSPDDAQGRRRADGSSGKPVSSELKVCGSQIHVVQRGDFPRRDAHVVLDQDGRPVSPFTFAYGHRSLACLPDGGVWAGGVLNEELLAVSSQREAPHGFATPGERHVLKQLLQSPDGGWAALLLPSGELRVVGDDPERARTVRHAMNAHAFSEGATVVQLLDGSFYRLTPGQPAVAIGRDDRPWTEGMPAGNDRVLVVSDSDIAVLTPAGLGRRWASVPDAIGLQPTVAGDGFIVHSRELAARFRFDADDSEPVRLPPLEEGEGIASMLMDGDRVYLATDRGRLVAADVASGAVNAQAALPVGGGSVMAPGSAGEVVLLSTDGVLRKFDSELREVGALWLGPAIRGDRRSALLWVPGSMTAVVATPHRAVTVDLGSFMVRQRLGALDGWDSLSLAPDGRHAIIFRQATRDQDGLDVARKSWRDMAAAGAVPPLADGEYDHGAILVLSPLCTTCGQ